MFLLLFSLSLRHISVVRLGKRNTIANREIHNDETDLSSFQRQFSNLQDSSSWTIFADYHTTISKNYISSIIDAFPQTNTVIGRIGCIPNSYVSNLRKTKYCRPYPSLKSGFIISNDLLQKLKYINDTITEYDFGVLLEDANFYDDFRFHYFSPFHSSRGKEFSSSFWQNEPLELAEEFNHVAGLPVNIMLSPKAQGTFTIGSNTTFFGEVVETNPQFSIHLKCSNVSSIEEPPNIYLRNVTIGVNCFTP